MNPADEMAAKIEPIEPQSASTVAGSINKLDEQLRVSVETLLHPSPPPKLVEEVDDLLLAISHHLDDEASERKAIYNRLRTIETGMERPASRGVAGYLLAACIGVVAAFAWQSYGESAKHKIATTAPELGWSPETKQMIASWVQQLGWTKSSAGPENTTVQAAPVAQTTPEMVAPNAPAALSLDPEQVRQIALDIAALRKNVEQLTTSQDQIAHEMRRDMARLESDLVNIHLKIPEPQPQRRGRR